MITVPMANRVKPVGPVEGSRRAMRTLGKPPGGGPSWITGMSLTDCMAQRQLSAESVQLDSTSLVVRFRLLQPLNEIHTHRVQPEENWGWGGWKTGVPWIICGAKPSLSEPFNRLSLVMLAPKPTRVLDTIEVLNDGLVLGSTPQV